MSKSPDINTYCKDDVIAKPTSGYFNTKALVTIGNRAGSIGKHL